MRAKDLLDVYKKIYKQSFIKHPIFDDNLNEYYVILTEKDKSAELDTLIIRNIPKNSILLPMSVYSNLKLESKMKHIFDSETGIFKCCDYVLLTMINDELHIFFIELKSINFDKKEVMKQFKGARCFIEYSNAIIMHFHDVSSFKLMEFGIRYFLFSKRPLNKRAIIKQKINPQFDDFIHHPLNVGNDKTAIISFGLFL
jgi:hypothetical protein